MSSVNISMNIKKNAVQFLKLVVTVGVIWWIVHSYGWLNILHTIAKANVLWLIVALLVSLISVYLGACQWHIILQNKNVFLPFWSTVKLYFVGMFFNNFIFGTVAGDAFKVASLHLDKRGGKTSFAATFLDRLAGLLMLSFFALAGGSIILTSNLQQNKQFVMVLGVLVLFASIFFGIFILLISRSLQNFAMNFLSILPRFPKKDALKNILEEIFINRRGKEEKKMLLKVVFLSFIIQTMRVSVHILCAYALGIHVLTRLHYFFVIIPVVALLMIAPMPFGIRETVGGILFGLAGFQESEAVIMEFLATILGIAASLVGGIMFLANKNGIMSNK